MKKQVTTYNQALILSVFMLLSVTASAQQFKKPISSPRDKAQWSDARFNIGIAGGANLTTWLHFHGPKAQDWYLQNYKPFDTITNSLGYFGGIAMEYMVSNGFSIGLNAIYAQHNLRLSYIDDSFPIDWDGTSIVHTTKSKTFRANYRTIEAYMPFTFYLTLTNLKNVTPYFYVAPRVSYLLMLPHDTTSQMTLTTSYANDPNATTSESVPFNPNTYNELNVGATIGLGSKFRIETSSFYFLVKFDISANVNALSTFTKTDLLNEFNHRRHSADANATLTIMLPVKKRLKGACVKWGEYD